MCITLYRTIMVFWQQDARIQAEQRQKDTKIKLEQAEKAIQEMEQQLEALQQAHDAVDSQARTDKKVYIAKKVAIFCQTALHRDKATSMEFQVPHWQSRAFAKLCICHTCCKFFRLRKLKSFNLLVNDVENLLWWCDVSCLQRKFGCFDIHRMNLRWKQHMHLRLRLLLRWVLCNSLHGMMIEKTKMKLSCAG